MTGSQSIIGKILTKLKFELLKGSRLESITMVYEVELSIGEETYYHLECYLSRLVDKVQVKRRQESIRIHQPL